MTTRLRISLFDNGTHSLWRGINAIESHAHAGQEYLIKDAVMALHHGIELLFKQMLVNKDPRLIFADLQDLAKKQKVASERGVNLFQLDRPPKTISYEEAIERVEAHIKPEELDTMIKQDLQELNRVRNSVEHYLLDADYVHIQELLKRLKLPLINLFEKHLGNISPRGVRASETIERSLVEQLVEFERLKAEIVSVMELFDGQVLPGEIFLQENPVRLPKFMSVSDDQYSPIKGAGSQYGTAVVVEMTGGRWVIEIRKDPSYFLSKIVRSLSSLADNCDYRMWFVFLDQFADIDLSHMQKSPNLYITTGAKWNKLKATLAAG